MIFERHRNNTSLFSFDEGGSEEKDVNLLVYTSGGDRARFSRLVPTIFNRGFCGKGYYSCKAYVGGEGDD